MSLCRLDVREDGGELQNYLKEKTGQSSVPNIFISAYERHILSVIVIPRIKFVCVVLEQQHIGGEISSF